MVKKSNYTIAPLEYKRIQETEDGKKFILLTPIFYYCERYDKNITVPYGYLSDGATGAMDIYSRGWWIHDKITDTGMFDDGTKLNNWQASRILSDVLRSEGRHFRAIYWLWATYLIGGKEARKNGLW